MWLGLAVQIRKLRIASAGPNSAAITEIAPLPLPPSASLQNIITVCSPLGWCLDQMSKSGSTAPREPCCGSSFSSLSFSRMSENREDEAQVGTDCVSTRNTLHDQTNLLSSPSRCISRLWYAATPGVRSSDWSFVQWQQAIPPPILSYVSSVD